MRAALGYLTTGAAALCCAAFRTASSTAKKQSGGCPETMWAIPADWNELKSPENYVGYERTEGFASRDVQYQISPALCHSCDVKAESMGFGW